MSNKYDEIGQQLKRRRTELGKELEDISEEIKVSVDYLRAIEEGDIKALPSEVYYKLFVRSYAGEIGLEPEKLLEEIDIAGMPAEMEEVTEAPRVKKKQTKVKSQRETSLVKLAIILSLIVVAIFVVVLVLTQTWEKEAKKEGGEIEKTAERPPDSLKGLAVESGVEESISPEIETPTHTTTQPMRLHIRIRETSWVLVRADGDTVLNRNLEDGDFRNLKANYRFVISLGNPNGVEITLNDTLLHPFSETGRPVRDIEINQLNKKDYFYIPEDSVVDEY
jgi:transcriptional regulator with XRE-family HTH domain